MSLFRLIPLCQAIQIRSKHLESVNDYTLTIKTNDERNIRQSVGFGKGSGTMTEISGIFQQLSVRRRTILAEKELKRIVFLVKYFSFVHPFATFKLFNVQNGDLLFQSRQSCSMLLTANRVFPYVNWTSLEIEETEYYAISGAVALNTSNGQSLEIVSINQRRSQITPGHYMQEFFNGKRVFVPSKGQDAKDDIKRRKFHYIVQIRLKKRDLVIEHESLFKFLEACQHECTWLSAFNIKFFTLPNRIISPSMLNKTAAMPLQRRNAWMQEKYGRLENITKEKEGIHGYTFKEATCIKLKNLTVIGQADKKYIICVEVGNFVVFDQHAIHERIRLESFQEKIISRGKSIERKKINVELNLEGLLIDNNRIKPWGFQIAKSRSKVYLTAVPQFFPNDYCTCEKISELFKEIFTEFQSEHDHAGYSTIPPPLNEMLKSIACHGAIKFNHELSLENMCHLLHDLSSCTFPYICAHGRTSVVRLQKIGAYE